MRVNSHNNWFSEVRTGGFLPAGFAVLPHRNIHNKTDIMSRMMELTSFPLLILISFSLRYPCIISRIAAFCGESLFLLAIIKTSKLSNVILHQFEGLHKLWDTPLKRIMQFYLLQLLSERFFWKHSSDDKHLCLQLY